MDDRERTKDRPDDARDDQNDEDTEGNLLGYGQLGNRKPDDARREDPTGRDEPSEEREGGPGIIPKR